MWRKPGDLNIQIRYLAKILPIRNKTSMIWYVVCMWLFSLANLIKKKGWLFSLSIPLSWVF